MSSISEMLRGTFWWCYLPCFLALLLVGIVPISSASRLPSNGQAPVANTPMLKNKWKNRSGVHHSYKAQVGLPASNAGDLTIRLTQSTSVIDIAIQAHTVLPITHQALTIEVCIPRTTAHKVYTHCKRIAVLGNWVQSHQVTQNYARPSQI